MKDGMRCDYHTHTKYLGCANETMDVPAMVRECERIGVTSLGITDHLNSLDKLELHIPIKKDIESLEPPIDIYFGVELNFLGVDGSFAYGEQVRDELGFQFAIGGIHGTYLDEYDLTKILNVQHRHHLKTCNDPLVDVLVHPYWFGKGEFDRKGWPWLDSMKPVPESYAQELGQVAVETGTAIEINACANLESGHGEQYAREYVEFLSIVSAEEAMFSVGSDAHDIGRLRSVKTAWDVVDTLGLTADRLWHPPCDPIAGPRAESSRP